MDFFCHSDPKGFIPFAYGIKATLGITGLLRVGVLILLEYWHLDVDSSYPPGVSAGKGAAVLRIKWNVSWVKYVVKQYGFYLLRDW